MSEKLLSVIMPVFNGEKYVSDALDSIFSAVSEENKELVEIVVVNDGSTDNTQQVLEDYQKKHAFVFARQENRGISFTTKRLFEMATGDYCWAVDHDDLLEEHSIDKIIGYLQSHKEKDLVIFNHCDFTDNGLKSKQYVDGSNFKDTSGQGVFVELLKMRRYSDPLWNRIISREMVIQNNIVKGHPNEIDLLLSIRLYSVAKNVGYIPELLYHHRIHPNSISHSQNTKQFQATCHLYAIDMLVKLIDDCGEDINADFLKALHTKINDLYFGAIAFGLLKNAEGNVDEKLVNDIQQYSWAMAYGKWNRKYIYRPFIKIFGLKAFCKVRK